MSKIWILYDTQFGNGKKLAESIQTAFASEGEFSLGDVKAVSPEKVAEDAPDILILGGAIRAFQGAPKSKKWLKELDATLLSRNKSIPFGVTYLTHGLPTDKVRGWKRRYQKKMLESKMIGKGYGETLTARVTGQEGPFAEGELEKVESFFSEFFAWTKN